MVRSQVNFFDITTFIPTCDLIRSGSNQYTVHLHNCVAEFDKLKLKINILTER